MRLCIILNCFTFILIYICSDIYIFLYIFKKFCFIYNIFSLEYICNFKESTNVKIYLIESIESNRTFKFFILKRELKEYRSSLSFF